MKVAPFKSIALAALSLLPLLASCTKENASRETGPAQIALGDKTLTIEFAITPSEQRKGLMGRDGIADDHGMLFVYQEPQQMSYWMKNVDFPIDIGFFTADGVLREVYPMYPQDTLARKSIGKEMLYALETRYRWFSENNIRPGAQLDLDAVRKALGKP
ncbi:DUF192 domain-containing protein [Pelagicoccus sp. SDUM812005]|uniref:DUF192 domain-containing protein n=1 Tax=Pelagicoccus sp. SDUM812005 TaxID=3041257 RepID=UPI00280CA22F|nr:DUF192 domain-containing protein [Pelagicoccus sp. SDUM812005]MDQ8180508.1 DUF192 domain-containing protein [Pelagicoccus sp. SDUM812005]